MTPKPMVKEGPVLVTTVLALKVALRVEGSFAIFPVFSLSFSGSHDISSFPCST